MFEGKSPQIPFVLMRDYSEFLTDWVHSSVVKVLWTEGGSAKSAWYENFEKLVKFMEGNIKAGDAKELEANLKVAKFELACVKLMERTGNWVTPHEFLTNHATKTNSILLGLCQDNEKQ